jgi:23S rRNA (uracil1939-C5)-methyltransferase
VIIESLDREGRGVGHVEGKAVFIDGALPGEIVEFTVTKERPSYTLGTVRAIVAESSARTTPRCPYFGVCGGCSLQHMEFRAQVASKQRVLEDTLKHIGSVQPETLLAPIYGPQWRYRHRARLSARFVPKKGGALVGFHERGSSYVADMRSCEVLPAHVSALLSPLRELIQSLSIARRLPQIEVAVGDRVTVLVLRILDPLTGNDERSLREFADLQGVQVWLQPAGPESAQPFHPRSMPALAYALPEFGLSMEFSPTDFTQVNHGVNEMLVRRALQLLEPSAGDTIGDFFCGLGNFTLPIARQGARVIGYEGSSVLIARARANAERHGLRADFAKANLFEAAELPQLERFDKLLIDPPRDGAAELMKALGERGAPRRVVYVSCDPATLARDAAILVHTKGFRMRAAGIANMFPHTSHVESIALFER